MSLLTDWARRTPETLDDPGGDAEVVAASLHDLVRVNRMFGGAAAAVSRLGELMDPRARGERLTLLDVGTGAGDIPRAAARWARSRGITLRLIGVERHPVAAREAARAGDLIAIIADGGRLPLRDRAVDLVLCVKVLHHLPGEPGTRLLAEMDRVARVGVVVSDIHRSAAVACGIWLASFVLGLHPATRRDAVISVLRGFRRSELTARCAAADVEASVRTHLGWWLTAAWRPARAGP